MPALLGHLAAPGNQKKGAPTQQPARALQPQQTLPSKQSPEDGDGGGTVGKGVISLLQEFVQCSRQFHAPQHRAILQWSFDNRMVDFTTLEFRSIVAFVLDGVPHHVAGEWHPSKKQAQRDTAERALSFFVGRWGEQLLVEQEGGGRPAPLADEASEVLILDAFCGAYKPCDGIAPKWTHVWDGLECRAVVEISLLGVSHKFGGEKRADEVEAMRDTAKRVLWYLQCPGFESTYTPDPRSSSISSKDIPNPPVHWVSEAENSAQQVAERKTALMRVQNKLQQVFAKQLRPGQSVWEWTYETDEEDKVWPPMCRASVVVPVVGKTFTGPWMRGQRDAQIEASFLVADYLKTKPTPSGGVGELQGPGGDAQPGAAGRGLVETPSGRGNDSRWGPMAPQLFERATEGPFDFQGPPTLKIQTLAL